MYVCVYAELALEHRDSNPRSRDRKSNTVTYSYGVTKHILLQKTFLPYTSFTCTELTGHWRLIVCFIFFFILFVSGYTCNRLSWSHSAFESMLNYSVVSFVSELRIWRVEAVRRDRTRRPPRLRCCWPCHSTWSPRHCQRPSSTCWRSRSLKARFTSATIRSPSTSAGKDSSDTSPSAR